MNPAIIPVFLIVNPNELLILFRFVYIYFRQKTVRLDIEKELRYKQQREI